MDTPRCEELKRLEQAVVDSSMAAYNAKSSIEAELAFEAQREAIQALKAHVREHGCRK